MFEVAERYLEGASGAARTKRVYPCGHEIIAEEVNDLAAWFSAQLG